MMMWTILTLGLVGFAVAGAISDVRTRRIPNRLVLAGLVLALVLRAAWGLEPLWHGVVAAGVALLAGFPLFALRAFGAGDIKFMAVCAAFVGWPLLGYASLAVAAAGGVLSIGIMVWKGLPLVLLHRTWELARSGLTLGRRGDRMQLGDTGAIAAPYGVAIAAGALVVWFGAAGGWLPL